MHATPIGPHAVSLLPWLHHLTFPLSSPVHHIPSPHPSPKLSPNMSPDSSPTPSPVVPYMTPAHPVMCYTRRSHVMCTTMGSTQLFANSLSNCSHIARWALPAIVATHFGVIHGLSLCLNNFYGTLYFILQITPYIFCPLSIRLLCRMQMYLENTYIQLWLNLV